MAGLMVRRGGRGAAAGGARIVLIPELFEGMPWSTDRLLGATLELLAGRSAELIDFFYDVDELDDLGLLRRHLAILPREVAVHTRAALVRAGLS